MEAQSTDPEAAAFAEALRSLLTDELPSELAARTLQGFHPLREDIARWQAILAAKGWGAPMWPTAFGGTGWSIRRQHAFEEACFLAGAPPQHFQSLRLVGPVLYTYGSTEQQQRLLPPILSGEHFWAQGFSEPGAGSDLAALRTTAVLKGDHYVVQGQKLWTSDAQFADWMILLVRTSQAGRPQQGLSFLLTPMDAPGITVRPVQSIDGSEALNEVFLDDVRVDACNLVGEENAGWGYAKFLLAHERSNTAEIPRLRRGLTRARALAAHDRGAPGSALAAEPGFPARLAQLEIDLMALQATVWRVLQEEESGLPGDPALPSILKIGGSELLQRINLMQAEALGEYALPAYPPPELSAQPPGPAYASGVMADLLYRRAATIFGGSNEIQRNLIARARLGA